MVNSNSTSSEIYVEVLARESASGGTIRGMLHRPPGFSSAQRYPAVVILHGFTGTRVEPHRLFVKTARQLAKQGIVAVRFDFWGSGESDGDFVDVTPETEIEDALTIINWLQAQAGIDRTRLGLIGMSLGGLVAACTAARSDQIKALCLWAATSHMGRRMRARSTPEVEQSLEQNGYVDLSGNCVGRAFFDVAAKLEPLRELSEYSGHAFIIHGTGDASVPIDEVHEYAAALQHCRPVLRIVDDADHTFNRMDWEKELIESTTQWLKANL